MRNKNKNFVSVVIPAHNEEEYIGRCLDSLVKQTLSQQDYEIIVVDNNSFDNTKKIVKSFSFVKYIFKEFGPVGAVRNYGAATSCGSILVFIDADCVCRSDWLEKARDIATDNPGKAYGGRYLLSDEANWLERYWVLKPKNSVKRQLLGGCICVRKSDFIRSGGFREDITSGEDTELGNQLNAIDVPIEVRGEFDVIHLGNAKTITKFIKRQIWHSENYIFKIDESIKDPTFILISVWFFLVIMLFFSLLFDFQSFGNHYLLIPLTFIPAIFTLKRISRSVTVNKLTFPILYFIDILYFFGRCLGIAKGMFNFLKTGYK